MKGATCHFCGQNFRNRQAVRAHLRGCAAYRQLPKATVPSIGSKAATRSGRGSDPGSRPASDPGPLSDSLRRQPPRIATDLSPDPYQKVLRRGVIQSVKDKAIGSWWQPGHTIPSEVKAQALVAIEQELARLPVDQLPRSELVTIAEGIRDRIYRPVLQTQQRAQEAEDRKRNQARQRTTLIASGAAHANQILRQQQDLDGWTRLDLEHKVKRALEQEIDGSESETDLQAHVDDLLTKRLEPIQRKRREQARQELIEHGTAYARRELAQEDDLDASERLSIGRDVERDLEEEVTGEESEDDVAALVDEILDEALGEAEEEDEEDDEDQEEDED